MIDIAHTKNSGMSDIFTLNNSLSVAKTAINIGMIAIENLKKSKVVESIPFWVSVRTYIPLDPNIIPARIGNIK